MTSSRILIVDDDPALLEALPETVKTRMKETIVHTADSACEALSLIFQTDYDAIVTDIKMPDMDGLALLRKVKELRPDTPTLLITGHGERDLAVQALRGSAYDFIQKPIDRDHFMASLTRAIHTRHLKRQVEEQKLALARHANELEQIVQERTHELLGANKAKDEFLRARDEALAQANAAQQRLAFLADVSRVLATSLDYTATLERIARIAIPTLGDYCMVSMTAPHGAFRRMAVAHVDGKKEMQLQELYPRMVPENMPGLHPMIKVLRSGSSTLYSTLSLQTAASEYERNYVKTLRS
ncbi:MAG: hypothetical protein C4293_22515, partial [Nitrospiraceae bacterium]